MRLYKEQEKVLLSLVEILSICTIGLPITARWYGELPSVSGLASFLPVQVDCTELSRHDKFVKMAKSRLTGRRFLVKVYFISGKAKNADSCASDGSPIDFVSEAGLVTVPKY
jgi:hypothetical protein